MKEEFAVVKTYRIGLGNGYRGTISYIVLNDGTLGYLLKEARKHLEEIINEVENYAHFER